MSRIISTAALSVNRAPQQEAAKPFYFTASAARPRTVSPLTQPIILFNVTLTSRGRGRRFSRRAYREVGFSACSEVTPVSAHLSVFPFPFSFLFDVHVDGGEFTDDTIPLEF